PSRKPLQTIPESGSAPIQLEPMQRVSIRPLPGKNNPNVSLYFTRAEFDKVVDLNCEYYGKFGQKFLLSPELVQYIWVFSGGRSGVVGVIMAEFFGVEV